MKYLESFAVLLFLPQLIFTTIISNGLENNNCSVLLDAFAIATSNFTACAVYNARPITLCEDCVQPYINVIETYNSMTKFADNDTFCIDNFINLDRLQIIQTIYKNNYDLWNNAKCYECYQTINGTISPNKSTETTIFFQYYDTLMKCLNQTNINDTTLCPTCMQDYINLDVYYNTISDENEKIGMCMDIVDLMNTTRSFWSVKCCQYRRRDEIIFLSSTVVILITTLLFYMAVQFCSAKKTPAIMQQTRFAESLNHPNE